MIFFLIRFVVLTTIWLILYKVLLHRKASLTASRIFLLVGMLGPLLLAFLPEFSGWEMYAPVQIALPEIVLEPQTVVADTPIHPFSITTLIAFVYVLGVLLTFGMTIFRLRPVWKLWITHPEKIVQGEHIDVPFSCWGKIFLPAHMESSEKEMILAHEQAHIRLFHQLDLAVMQVYCMLTWFLPFQVFIRRWMLEIHEYQADKIALVGRDKRDYGFVLLKRSMGARYKPLTHAFAAGNLKTRIYMMYKQSNVKMTAVRLVLFFTCMLATGWFISCNPATNNEVQEAESDAKVVQPEFPGGMAALQTFLMENVRYPEAAFNSGTQGQVILAFIITENGKVSDVKVKKSVSTELDAEAIRVIAAMPDWKPGTKNGEPQNMELQLPVTFKL